VDPQGSIAEIRRINSKIKTKRKGMQGSVSQTTVLPWSGLALGLGSFALPKPHGAQLSLTPLGSHLSYTHSAPAHPIGILAGAYHLSMARVGGGGR